MNEFMMVVLETATIVLAVLIIRKVAWKKCDPNLIYFLWIFVALRILMPTHLTLSVETRGDLSAETKPRAIWEILAKGKAETEVLSTAKTDPEQTMEGTSTAATEQIGSEESRAITGKFGSEESRTVTGQAGKEEDRTVLEQADRFLRGKAARILWALGCLGLLVYFVIVNLQFRKRVLKNKAGQTEEGIPIYETESVNGLVGILRPAILISTEVRKNERQKEFVIRHELEHLRAKDNFWILIKNLCLMLQWYNPFVWIAYLKAAEDCELACDARVAKGLAPEGRESYAAFLLETASHGRRSLAVASTMSGDGKSLKKRITSMFMKQKGKRFWWLVLLLAGITLAVVLRVALVPGDREARGETKTQEQTSPPSETAEPSASPVVANSITTPWDYPIQPGSEEWLAMDVAEAMAMLDVPADIVDAMTTQALLETVINYPMISNIYMYGDTHFGISATKNAFYALDALLEREDAKNILEGSLADVRKRMPSLEGEEERLAATERETLLKALLQYVTGDYPSSEKLEKEKEYQY